MMKFAVLIALIGAVAASGIIPAVPVVSKVVTPVIAPVVSSQRAIIPQISSYGYGNGISSRYFDKVDYGYGSGSFGLGLAGYPVIAPGYYGINNLGLAYNNYGLYNGSPLGFGYGYGYGGLGRFGYGYGGLRH